MKGNLALPVVGITFFLTMCFILVSAPDPPFLYNMSDPLKYQSDHAPPL